MMGTLRMSVTYSQVVIKDYSEFIKNVNCSTKNAPSSGFGTGVLNGLVDSE